MSKLSDPKIGGPVAGVLLIAALGYAFYAMGGDDGPTYRKKIERAYFYDLGEKKLFPHDAKDQPPVEAPSGFKTEDGQPGGVRAHVFGCGDCSEPFIGYLQTLTAEGKAMLDSGDPTMIYKTGDEYRIRAAEGGEWYESFKPEAKKIIGDASARCPAGTKTVPCNPE